MSDAYPFAREAAYVMEQVRHVIESFGPRPPASAGERKAQEYVAGELGQWADTVEIEPFNLAPKAFMAFLPVCGLLLVLSFLFYWILPSAALTLSAMAVAVVLVEFVLYRPLMDPLFPKAESRNVIAKRHASGTPKRRIIVNGHIDAAYEWRYNFIAPWLLRLVGVYAVIGLVVTFLTDAAFVFWGGGWQGGHGDVWVVVGLIQLCLVPGAVLVMGYTRFSVVSPGANDNLSGVFVAMGLLKDLHESGTRFEDTEVWCLITGSEEAGVRGAKAFAKRHLSELKEIETAFVALETFRDIPHLAVCAGDMNGLVKSDVRVNGLIADAAAQCGVKIGSHRAYIGASDASAFNQAGIPASCLAGMDTGPPRYYHTRLDNWDNMNPECIAHGFAIGKTVIHDFAEKGLDRAGGVA